MPVPIEVEDNKVPHFKQKFKPKWTSKLVLHCGDTDAVSIENEPVLLKMINSCPRNFKQEVPHCFQNSYFLLQANT